MPLLPGGWERRTANTLQMCSEMYHEAFSRASDSNNAGVTATEHAAKGFAVLSILLQLLLRLAVVAKRLDCQILNAGAGLGYVYQPDIAVQGW